MLSSLLLYMNYDSVGETVKLSHSSFLLDNMVYSILLSICPSFYNINLILTRLDMSCNLKVLLCLAVQYKYCDFSFILDVIISYVVLCSSIYIMLVYNIVTCWVCHMTNNFTWVLDIANLYWTLTLTHLTIIIASNITWLLAQYFNASSQLSLAVAGPQLSSAAAMPRLSFSQCITFLYLWPLLRVEPSVVTVETPVRITIPQLLLPMQRSVLAFPWK
jgi:hypothetical protein